MEIRKTLYVTSREEWRAWLTEHYQSETEVWLIYYKKHTGRPRISYDHAVEEALCFGWIDSIGKRMGVVAGRTRYDRLPPPPGLRRPAEGSHLSSATSRC